MSAHIFSYMIHIHHIYDIYIHIYWKFCSIRERLLLTSILGDPAQVEEHATKWRKQSKVWALNDDTFKCDPGLMAQILTGLMNIGAYPGEHKSLGYTSSFEEEEPLRLLEVANVVECKCNRWYLTESGADNVEQTQVQLSAPQKFFRVRSELPLEDQTVYEHVRQLTDSGWNWRLWIARSNRRKGAALSIPYGYCKGEEKTFYLSFQTCPQYTRTLLCAEATPPHTCQ
jgi:hypothetical protein